MKKIIIVLALAFSLLPLQSYGAPYTVDKDHSSVEFRVRHMMISKVSGEFKDYEGSFEFDEKKPANSKVKFTIQAASINTNHEKRDGHLKSADFFEVEKHPTLNFESKKVTSVGGKKYKLSGSLTIHGVIKEVTFQVEYMGSVKDPYGNQRAGFVANTKINRKDFGLTWNKTLETGGLIVGDEVEIQLNIEGIEKK